MAAAVLAPARPPVRRTGPSLPAQVGLEARKSLSTRSGLALTGVALFVAPAAMALAAAAANQPLDRVSGPLVVGGMLSVLVLVSLGVLSTAGEWSHGTVQTTYLLEPRRARVLAAKAVAVTLLGAVVAGAAATLAAAVLGVMEPSASWSGIGRAVGMMAVAGATFALIGAGIGAAIGNSPGALTAIYLVDLGALPMLQVFNPALADKIDPGNAVLSLALRQHQAQSDVILAVWLGVALIAGAVMTRRRAVQ